MTRRQSDFGQSQNPLQELRHQASGLLREIKTAARETTGDLSRQASEVSRAVSDTVKEEAQRLLDERREAIAGKVGIAAKLARQTGHALRAVRLDNAAEVADAAAGQVRKLGDYLKESDVSQILEDAEQLTRNHRALVTGGLLVTGFALVRFLKASAEPQRSNSNGGSASGRGQGKRRGDGSSRNDK